MGLGLGSGLASPVLFRPRLAPGLKCVFRVGVRVRVRVRVRVLVRVRVRVSVTCTDPASHRART